MIGSRLTLVETLPSRGAGKPLLGRWRCQCGRETVVANTRVRSGRTKSCGCLAREVSSVSATVHGGRNSRTYSTWQSMKRRCHEPTDKDFPKYGARGITVCDLWRDDFAAFRDCVGERPAGTTIDRIDPKKGYAPGNVRWATPLEQSRNRSDLTVVNTPKGVMALVDYAKTIGLTKGAAHLRLKRGKLEGVTHV